MKDVVRLKTYLEHRDTMSGQFHLMKIMTYSEKPKNLTKCELIPNRSILYNFNRCVNTFTLFYYYYLLL